MGSVPKRAFLGHCAGGLQSLSLWNHNDLILKERIFGLTGSEGNHGEDVKEYYFYLDATPTLTIFAWGLRLGDQKTCSDDPDISTAGSFVHLL
jgi:hypothetical protein